MVNLEFSLSFDKVIWYRNLHADLIASQSSSHIFSVSGRVMNSFTSAAKDQYILVSGESGSGKTESVKQLLRHIAFLSSICSSPCRDNITEKVCIHMFNRFAFVVFLCIVYDWVTKPYWFLDTESESYSREFWKCKNREK